MIQEKNNEVLKAIVNLVGETDAFKILDADEIIAAVPSGLALDKNGLKEAIKEISDREMINVKYSNDDEYCLAALFGALVGGIIVTIISAIVIALVK